MAKQIFDDFDLDGNGLIDADELQEAVKQIGFEMSMEEVLEFLKTYDEDGNGSLNFEEYQLMMQDLIGQSGTPTLTPGGSYTPSKTPYSNSTKKITSSSPKMIGSISSISPGTVIASSPDESPVKALNAQVKDAGLKVSLEAIREDDESSDHSRS